MSFQKVYTICITIALFIRKLDKWLRRSSVKLNPEKDIIVITGGGTKGGLGHNIALEFLFNQGFSIAVLSLYFEWEPRNSSKALLIPCDVTDPVQVRAAREKIQKHFPGKSATVLINNAGLAHNKTVLEMEEQTIRKVIEVNLMGAFWTVRTFVPDMISNGRGYIVNVSSVLGTIGVAQLSAYCASKAGLTGFHDSITHELSNPYKFFPKKTANISTLLVAPGHITTSMFTGLTTPSGYIGPLLSPEHVSKSIVDAVIRGETGTVALPLYTRFTWLLNALPGVIGEFARSLAKMDQSMDTYIGARAPEPISKST